MAKVGALKTLLGRLAAFQQSLPKDWRTFPAEYVDEYSAILAELERAGFDTQSLAIPPGAIKQRSLMTNYATRERALSKPEIDHTILRSRVGGAIAFIENLLDRGDAPARPATGFGPITITGSSVNLGTVHGDMRTSIQVMENRGQEQLARLLADLVAQIAASRLSAPEKDDAAQLVETLAREVATKPAGKLSAAVRPVASALGSILTRSAELAQIWQALQPFLTT